MVKTKQSKKTITIITKDKTHDNQNSQKQITDSTLTTTKTGENKLLDLNENCNDNEMRDGVSRDDGNENENDPKNNPCIFNNYEEEEQKVDPVSISNPSNSNSKKEIEITKIIHNLSSKNPKSGQDENKRCRNRNYQGKYQRKKEREKSNLNSNFKNKSKYSIIRESLNHKHKLLGNNTILQDLIDDADDRDPFDFNKSSNENNYNDLNPLEYNQNQDNQSNQKVNNLSNDGTKYIFICEILSSNSSKEYEN